MIRKIFNRITLKDLFPGQNHEEILSLNKKCIITLNNLPLYKTPTKAIELIQKMLIIEPKDRITAIDALKSDFFSINNELIEKTNLKKLNFT